MSLVFRSISQVSFTILGGISVVLGGISAFQSHFSHPQYSYLPPDEVWNDFLTAFPEGNKVGSSVVVEVAGAVEKPGVYTLSSGARWQDALLQAGGFMKQASQRYIHQEVNLAKIILDQEKIYIPFQLEEQGEETKVSKVVSRSLNQLTQKEVEAVPGIGAVRAEKFLSGIPYSSLEDFANRSGLPDSVRQEMLKMYSL